MSEQEEIESAGRDLRVRLVLHPSQSGWIIHKFAARLQEHLPRFGVTAELGETASDAVDLNHWMLFIYCVDRPGRGGTALITHIDHPIQLREAKACLKVVDLGICLSRMGVDELVRRGVARDRLCAIVPGHDGALEPRRIRIGITTRLYTDGRKREELLARLADAMPLDAFAFEIFGAGWEAIVEKLAAAGAEVAYHPGTSDYQADYRLIRARLPQFDYYLYLGMDEGSMGFLDALAAGVATIVTPQGFHLDVPGGITHEFLDFPQLHGIFQQLRDERRRRIESVRELTWSEYARRHALVWRALLAGCRDQIPRLLEQSAPALPPLRPAHASAWARARAETEFWGKPLRNRWRRALGTLARGRDKGGGTT